MAGTPLDNAVAGAGPGDGGRGEKKMVAGSRIASHCEPNHSPPLSLAPAHVIAQLTFLCRPVPAPYVRHLAKLQPIASF